MAQKRIIMPLPRRDFDPTEVSVPWKIICDAGHKVIFATVGGQRGYADPMMLTGEGLDPWGWIPGLNKIKLIGLLLRANSSARAAYEELQQDREFLNPKQFGDLEANHYDGMILPGGHAPAMKLYLEDKTLQAYVADFFETTDHTGNHKPVGAICHGVLVAVRSISQTSGKSVLFGRKTTALTWALEKSAWDLTKYFARFWDPNYYRTYMESSGDPPGYWSVESEVKRGLEKESDFIDVPKGCEDYFSKTSGISRDSIDNIRPAYEVRDGTYISAR